MLHESHTLGQLHIDSFFDPATQTATHLVYETTQRQAAIIDSVLDYDPKSGRIQYTSADALIAHVRKLNLQVCWLLETHVHADHLSAAAYLKQELGGQIAIGEHITQVQRVFGQLFNAEAEFTHDGRQFDVLLTESSTLPLGAEQITVLHTPGHTPACLTYVMASEGPHGLQRGAFVGDTLFMPDFGTARCDFPGGSAQQLYQSIQKVLALPDDTVLFMCHDYPPNNRAVKLTCTVGQQKSSNVHIQRDVSEAAFVHMRQTRDATLDMPVLILPSVQINMRAGHTPPPESNGVAYIKIPINAL